MRSVLAAALFTSSLAAQFGTESLPDPDLGRPPAPPLITAMAIAAPGKLITDPSFPPTGPVAKSVYEELGAITVTTTFDIAGHIIEETRKEGANESHTIYRYTGNRRISQESTKFANYWTYDPTGKLIEFRRTSGDQLQNHDTNFQRDPQGRLTGYEYRQGPNDDLLTRTELHYSEDGRTIETTIYDNTEAVLGTTTRTLDNQNRVIAVEISEKNFETRRMDPPINVTFLYDAKGRVIEQNTAVSKFYKFQNEDDLPPGKVTIVFDDAANTKTTSFNGANVKLGLTVTHNAAGAVTAFTGGSATMRLNSKIDCINDTHGNWTSCKLIVTTAGEPRTTRTWRRTITYRDTR